MPSSDLELQKNALNTETRIVTRSNQSAKSNANGELYSAAMIPDRKWSPDMKWSPKWTANDPKPQMIPIVDRKWSPPENNEWYGFWVLGSFRNRVLIKSMQVVYVLVMVALSCYYYQYTRPNRKSASSKHTLSGPQMTDSELLMHYQPYSWLVLASSSGRF